MPRIVYSERFIDDAHVIRLAKKRKELRRHIEQLADFPKIGSRNLPAYIRKEYGPHVRKLLAHPFIVIYEYAEESDTVNILGLVHQKHAW